MTCVSGGIPFSPHRTQQISWFWADLAKMHWIEMMHCGVVYLPMELMIAAGTFHLPCECVALD